ncbi:hypothetical protein Phou_048300 [Phytohabitans houttuyneae]|uniref:Uncharacterized protein n=1 Tax=Phytohabitans houttuyneae TaxID=1076126 RepID=A0A6V8KB59_9ACTN|nr:hypothetical protein Phou_048300 [Phytohabitans houttuyneae]
MQAAARHVRDAAAGRVGPRVDDRAGRGDLRDVAADQVGAEELSAEREGGDLRGRVRRVRPDAARGEPQPLAQRPLLGGQVAAVVGEQPSGLGDQALAGGLHVEHPERVRTVLWTG